MHSMENTSTFRSFNHNNQLIDQFKSFSSLYISLRERERERVQIQFLQTQSIYPEITPQNKHVQFTCNLRRIYCTISGTLTLQKGKCQKDGKVTLFIWLTLYTFLDCNILFGNQNYGIVNLNLPTSKLIFVR